MRKGEIACKFNYNVEFLDSQRTALPNDKIWDFFKLNAIPEYILLVANLMEFVLDKVECNTKINDDSCL